MYSPGQEPKALKKHLNLLLRELRAAYPEGLVVMDMWNHERWDKLAGYLVQKLGYPNGRSFLKAYGFDVFEEDLAPEEPATNEKESTEAKQEVAAAAAESAVPSEEEPPVQENRESDEAAEKHQECPEETVATVPEKEEKVIPSPQNSIEKLPEKNESKGIGETTFAMAKFYEQCQEKGYTDMADATQSLKAKVIATDLGLDYGSSIGMLYFDAAKCYDEVIRDQKAEAARKKREAVPGKLVVTFSDQRNYSSSSGFGKKVEVFLRPDGTMYYTINRYGKTEGVPRLSVNKGGVLSYSYHPSKAIYTGATVGGVTTGGVHFTQAYNTEHYNPSDTGYIVLEAGSEKITVQNIIFSDLTKKAFRRDEQFQKIAGAGTISCYKGSVYGNIYADAAKYAATSAAQMTMLSKAADESRLSYNNCVAIVTLAGRVLHKDYPPSDEALYKNAMTMGEATRSEELKKSYELFERLSDFKDSKEQAVRVKERYNEYLQREKEQAIIERDRARAEEQKAREKKKKKLSVVLPIVVILLVAAYYTFHTVIPEKRYQKAAELMLEQNYAEAAKLYDSLGSYKDSFFQYNSAKELLKQQQRQEELEREKAEVEARSAPIYRKAEIAYNEGRYEDALSLFYSISDYRDSAERAMQAAQEYFYVMANDYLEKGEYYKAYDIYSQIGDYKDVKEILKTNDKIRKAVYDKFAVGKIVKYGEFAQGADRFEETPLEWVVLEQKDGKALLLTKDIIDWRLFKKNGKTRNAKEIDDWLRTDFMDSFTEGDETAIAMTTWSSDPNPQYPDTSQSNPVKQKVFLLSAVEAEKYVIDNPVATNAELTEYVRKTYKDAESYWMLRTKGYYFQTICVVWGNNLDYGGYYYLSNTSNKAKQEANSFGVRPAMWIDLDMYINRNRTNSVEEQMKELLK